MIIFRILFLSFLFNANCSVFAQQLNKLKEKNRDFSTQPSGTGDTVIIRFDYKQSALFHQFTFDVIDSVVNILEKDPAVRLSIDGYAFEDEGNDTICYFLSQNRAIFIQTYILGRGIDSSKIITMHAFGKRHAKFTSKDNDGFIIKCRAELIVIYPPPPPTPLALLDSDEDGITDDKDKCPYVFGYKDNMGCPDSGAVLIPFAIHESSLATNTYRVMDSVISVLKTNPSLFITISGHAHLAEGSYAVCKGLAIERAEIVKNYLLSRMVNPNRIIAVKSYDIRRPINTAKTPLQVLKNARAEILFEEK